MGRLHLRRPGLLLLLVVLPTFLAQPAVAEDAKTIECATEWEPGRIGGYRNMTIPFRTGSTGTCIASALRRKSWPTARAPTAPP